MLQITVLELPVETFSMIGKTLGHYRILEKIGQVGMGEVFLADDTSLHRRVALKFLPHEMQRDAAAHKRFLREARSAAALDHPFICHINEVAEYDGQDFIVMEYVDGQSVKDRPAQGPLPLDDAGLHHRIFICIRKWRFIVFANLKYRVGGINYLGFNVFLRRCIIEHNRLVSPSGSEVGGESTLVYFMAHELTHTLEANLIGRYRQWRLPTWQKEGYADYVARGKVGFNSGQQLSNLQKHARELDPERSGLYLRYDLMVTYLLDFKGLDPKTLLTRSFDQAALERELAQLEIKP